MGLETGGPQQFYPHRKRWIESTAPSVSSPSLVGMAEPTRIRTSRSNFPPGCQWNSSSTSSRNSSASRKTRTDALPLRGISTARSPNSTIDPYRCCKNKPHPSLLARAGRGTYASEADLLNVALFGQTAKQWRDTNPTLESNMRDSASVQQPLVLANIESLNAEFIQWACPRDTPPEAERRRDSPDADVDRQSSHHL